VGPMEASSRRGPSWTVSGRARERLGSTRINSWCCSRKSEMAAGSGSKTISCCINSQSAKLIWGSVAGDGQGLLLMSWRGAAVEFQGFDIAERRVIEQFLQSAAVARATLCFWKQRGSRSNAQGSHRRHLLCLRRNASLSDRSALGPGQGRHAVAGAVGTGRYRSGFRQKCTNSVAT
jgi:hypothetical protein